MQYNAIKGLTKGIMVFLFVVAGVVVQAVAEALTGFRPDDNTPQYIVWAWGAVVPTVAAGLKVLSNYLKIKAAA